MGFNSGFKGLKTSTGLICI